MVGLRLWGFRVSWFKVRGLGFLGFSGFGFGVQG